MKIIQLVCAYPPYAGGIGTSAANLRRYFNWPTITLAPPGITPPSLDGVTYLNPLIRLGHGALPKNLWAKIKAYDLIYFHYPFFGVGLLLWLALVRHNRPRLIVQYHMDTTDLKGWKRILSWPEKITSRWLFDRAEKIVVSSLDYIATGPWKKYYQKNQTKFVAIPFAVDTQKFFPKKIDHQEKKKIIFVGGLDQAHYFKGVDNLLQALAKSQLNNWQLSIAGSGNLEKHYQHLTQELGIEKRVNFLGKLDDQKLVAAYQDHDVLILPSINRHEAFGIVLIEAMACGLAVIASDLPGVRSVFTDEQEGLKVRPNDIADLTRKIEEIFANPEKLHHYQLAARQLAETKYSTESIKRKIQDMIKEA